MELAIALCLLVGASLYLRKKWDEEMGIARASGYVRGRLDQQTEAARIQYRAYQEAHGRVPDVFTEAFK